MNNLQKKLETYINDATNQNTKEIKPDLFIDICNIINSRSDM